MYFDSLRVGIFDFLVIVIIQSQPCAPSSLVTFFLLEK